MVIAPIEMLARMGAAVALGGVIGFERERARRQAGLRTHLIVALASSTFMLVSTQFVYFQRYAKDDLVAVDTSRIAASVVSGIGFLGAGAILRTGFGIQGLTTAASLWLVASIGLASGGGMYLTAAAATLGSLFALMAMRKLENKELGTVRRKLTFFLEDATISRQSIFERLTGHGVAIGGFDLDRDPQSRTTEVSVDARFPNDASLERIIGELEGFPGIKRFKVTEPAG